MANPGSLLLKLIIDGTSAGAIKALSAAEFAARKTGKSLSEMDVGGNLDNTRAALTAVESQLKNLQKIGGDVLKYTGIGLGISELIQLADTYTQMTSRLKLVTQYTGDFKEVFSGLADSARDTRSSLNETVSLYVQMAPALAGIGLNGQQSIGVITTINQAIALSGASSQAAAAALVQLGQGFNAGALRGEELNSVLEQTPAVAQAIADGLGVPIGSLRKLGEQGELTAAKVAGALQKMAPQLAADFAKMPVTVGQALTGLKNEFLLYVGATDQATSSTSTLAGIIRNVADEFHNGGPVVSAFSSALKTLANGVDGAYRALKILGIGLGAYAAMAREAFSGNFSGVRDIYRQLSQDVDEILQKPLVTQRQVEAGVADSTKKRQLLEAQLASEMERLEKLKLYNATGAMDGIVAKEKEAVNAMIADQQRLVDAMRSAWQASLEEAKNAANAAQSLLDKAAQKRSATADKVFNAQTKGLSPEEQAAASASRAQELLDQGKYYAAASNAASLDGRFKQAEQYQKQAEQFLQRAESFADKAGTADLIQGVGDAQAQLLESQAKAEQAKAQKLQEQAASQAQLLNEFQTRLEALQAKARAIEVKADVTDAETKIKGLEGQLAALKDKTVTVTVNTVTKGLGPSSYQAPDGQVYDFSSYGPGYYGGGWTGPGSKYTIAGFVHADEHVTRKEIVNQPGALAFLNRFNAIGMAALKGYANGGLVQRLTMPAMNLSGLNFAAAGPMQPVHLHLGDREFPMAAPPEITAGLVRYFRYEALRKGGRR